MADLSAEAELILDLVVAHRVLAARNVIADGFGHVSARSRDDPNRFLMSRARGAEMVSAEDILQFDLDSTPLDSRGRRVFGERFIHGEIFKARGDVQAVMHSHTASLIPFSVTAVPLRPIFHMSGFLIGGAPVFEIRETAGDSTDMLVNTAARGRALARKLAQAPVLLLRGHGLVVVGASVKQVVFRAIYTDLNARLQAKALGMGEITFLTEAEATNTALAQDATLERFWEVSKDKVLSSARRTGNPLGLPAAPAG